MTDVLSTWEAERHTCRFADCPPALQGERIRRLVEAVRKYRAAVSAVVSPREVTVELVREAEALLSGDENGGKP